MIHVAGLRWAILVVLVGVAVASSLFGVLGGAEGWSDLALNFGIEMAGAVVTYGLIELILGRREAREGRKQRLISDMRSGVRKVAIAAARELSRQGWLTDGSLQGAHMPRANLQGANLLRAHLLRANMRGANLGGADLQGANLLWANLGGADLGGANLLGSYLGGADLREANLGEADLRAADLGGADLRRANLEGADLGGVYLWHANLQGARLQGASLNGAYLQRVRLQGASLNGAFLNGAYLNGAYLEGADLRGATFDEKMTLPDGTMWTSDADVARFTDPKHPDFWRPPQDME